MDNLSKLGWLASEVLLKDGFDKSKYQPEEIGIVLTNANSSLDADLKYWDSVQDMASPSLFVYTLPNIVIGEICIRNGFKGEDALYLTPLFDAAFLQQQVSYLLDNDILKACICGWVDVVGDDYKSALFLVEKSDNGIEFSVEELNKIFTAQ
ncbi:ATP-binding protein [Mucilaginibacter jinjuensis]|uniref:ATP-binding protein n=1 Tax=Mucilaginibacter jinjuensis TaxID=1176721 RepID=A0ABY7T766_9SPHI|nr:ATP-binding protein [Mucilaginibacter jinjuensis]WCT12191.1 ATP-binding protein [Mucilaginibacter jinjuensis]